MSSKITLIDAHCHVNFPDFAADRDAVIDRAAEQGIGMILVGTSLATSREVVTLAEAHAHIWAIVGIHPVHAHGIPENEIEAIMAELKTLALRTRTVGIGECGFDYFHLPQSMLESGMDMPAALARQKYIFMAQIRLANEVKKPLMLHIRNASVKKADSGQNIAADSYTDADAYGDTLTLIREHSTTRGDAHFFAGTVPQMQAFIDLNYTVSFTGVVTFAKDYAALVKAVPAESFLVETDAPYVAPVPHRGRRNEPAYVLHVAEKIAELRGVTVEEVKRQSLENTKKLFGILEM